MCKFEHTPASVNLIRAATLCMQNIEVHITVRHLTPDTTQSPDFCLPYFLLLYIQAKITSLVDIGCMYMMYNKVGKSPDFVLCLELNVALLHVFM